MKKNNILITGGEGFIGCILSKFLLDIGYNIFVIDDNRSSVCKNLPNIHYYKFSVQDRIALKLLFSKYSFDGIFHLAASAYVSESVKEPISYFDNNLSSTISLLEVLSSSDFECPIIFSSSCAVYGDTKKNIKETDKTSPINPYGMSKLMCEDIINEYCKRYNSTAIFLRFFNVAGADNINNLGEIHNPETHIIPLLLKSCFGDENLKIYGTKFATPDGSAVRDYIHVLDLVNAMYKSLLYANTIKGAESLNLGDGVGSSIFELINYIKRMGLNPKFELCDNRPGDPPFLSANNSKAKKILNWRPKYNVEETINDAHKFFLNNNMY